MAKINLQRYEDYTEAKQCAQYFYGRMSLDYQCSYCGAISEDRDMVVHEPCQHCGEWSGWIEMES
jgi:hypothetical protein